MNLAKSLIIISILLFSVIGILTFADSLTVVSAQDEFPGGQTWIQYNESNVKMTALTATITVTIKNNDDHVQYFKISQVYSGSLQEGDNIRFTVDWTSPQAERMIDPVSPELGGDWGWAIQPGETKTVKFNVDATGLMGNEPSWIANGAAVPNTFWPLIPDMGLMASWFMPNEIEMLNPELDLISWCGIFGFTATNYADYSVAGIIRGPIIPTDSKLTFSDPQAFIDEDVGVFNTNIAAWNIHLNPGQSQRYVYIYNWPMEGSGSATGTGQTVFPAASEKNATTVPTETTGAPYGLFVVAVLIIGAGIGYAKFLR